MAYGLINAVAVLILACPCALGLATPMSIMVAMVERPDRRVFKNAKRLRSCVSDTLVVDKTGTLTEGKPKLVSIVTPQGSMNYAIRWAPVWSEASEHPLAAALWQAPMTWNRTPETESFESITGKGVTGLVDDTP